jgi:hypothetical protein
LVLVDRIASFLYLFESARFAVGVLRSLAWINLDLQYLNNTVLLLSSNVSTKSNTAMNTTENRRFIAYCRVSTARQGRSGLGLEAQRQAVASHLNGAELDFRKPELQLFWRTDSDRRL